MLLRQSRRVLSPSTIYKLRSLSTATAIAESKKGGKGQQLAYLVTCPSCFSSFDPGASIRQQIEQDLQKQMTSIQAKKEAELKSLEEKHQKAMAAQQREADLKLKAEKIQLQKEVQESMKKSIAMEYENQLKMLQNSLEDHDKKLRSARAKELEFLKKEQELKVKEAEMESELQKRLLKEQNALRDLQLKKETELKKLETEHQKHLEKLQKESEQKLKVQKTELQKELQDSLRRSVAQEYDNQLKLLQSSLADNEQKLQSARSKELEFLKKEQALKNREAEMEIELQKRLLSEQTALREQISKAERERNAVKETEFQGKIRELEKQLSDQQRLAEEMRKKAEQGSMQLQGEVLELHVEEQLKATFPFDKIEEVRKGVKGADCIQTVCNELGQPCGKIIFECKQTKHFSESWIEKLKTDLRSEGADVAVLVTSVLPKDTKCFSEKDGIYVCLPSELVSLTTVLRTAIRKVAEAKASQRNKGDKVVMLYDYLMSNEFSEQWRAIREGYLSLKMGIQRERDAMEKLWKAREKQLEKVLLNATSIRGSIEGIAGSDIGVLELDEWKALSDQ